MCLQNRYPVKASIQHDGADAGGGHQKCGPGWAFKHVLSTDRIRAYKLTRGRIKWRLMRSSFSVRTFFLRPLRAGTRLVRSGLGTPVWVNRLNLPAEESGVAADAMGQDITAW